MTNTLEQHNLRNITLSISLWNLGDIAQTRSMSGKTLFGEKDIESISEFINDRLAFEENVDEEEERGEPLKDELGLVVRPLYETVTFITYKTVRPSSACYIPPIIENVKVIINTEDLTDLCILASAWNRPKAAKAFDKLQKLKFREPFSQFDNIVYTLYIDN